MKKSVALFAALLLVFSLVLTSCGSKGTKGLEYLPVADGSVYGVQGSSTTRYLSHIEIPSKYQGKAVTQILPNAFKGSSNLTSITIPDSVTSIGGSAFLDCTSLTSVTLGNHVTSIDYFAFSDCTSLTSITIPDSVTSIGNDAFDGCTSLTSVTLGNSVTSIDAAAFGQCTSLTSIIIPASVKSINALGFYECTSLTSITFEGTKAQWNAITKGTNWNYQVPATEVICSDGVVPLD